MESNADSSSEEFNVEAAKMQQPSLCGSGERY